MDKPVNLSPEEKAALKRDLLSPPKTPTPAAPAKKPKRSKTDGR